MSPLDESNIRLPGDLKPTAADAAAPKKERSDLERQQQKLADLAAESLKQDIDLRNEYAKKIYRLLIGWLLGVVLLIVLCGLAILEIPTTVLTALVSGVSLGVIGLLATVAKYLFNVAPQR